MSETDGQEAVVDIHAPLMGMTNRELYAHGVAADKVSLLENELLHRLETYLHIYGDYLAVASKVIG